MLSMAEQRNILKEVEFGDWRFEVRTSVDEQHGRYLQVVFEDEDNYNPGQQYLSKGRKWNLSPHMTKSEVVLTAWKAVLTALEHEAREKFQYRGRTIFGPHIDVDALYEASALVDVRS